MSALPDSPPAPAYLERLNPAQRRAVEYGVGATPGPLLVIAGAGSGKTNTLAHRVTHLIATGADPRKILLLTFSRRAATEMSRRVERISAEIMGNSSAIGDALTWAGTFHGIGARLLREHAPLVGLDQSFSIHDREDSADLMNIVRHELGFSATSSRFPAKGTCLAIYSRAVNAQAELADVLKFAFPWVANWTAELRELFAAYVEAKQQQNVLDYDDLLLYWAGMMADPGIAADLGQRFSHILVDEYQDTNRLQARVLLALKPDGAGLTVVGDDAQSIYSFRAATVRNILEFPGSFSPAAEIITLDRNYRSTLPILEAANAVISRSPERYAKDLWTDRRSAEKPQLVTVRDESDQVRYVVEHVLEARERGLDLRQQAVLFRTSSHSGLLEIELTRRNIPFVKFGGLKFLDSAHVKDMLALLRFAENPRDRVAGFRILTMLPGIGPASAGKLLDTIADSPRPLATLAEATPPAKAAEAWPGLAELMAELGSRRAGWPSEFDLARTWYEPIAEPRHDDWLLRQQDLLQLQHIASGFPSRERFLTELTLDPPDATSEAAPPLKDEDYLILSTIHSAKGQEWRSVHVLNVADGGIPSDLGMGTPDEIEEERRLLYVAMTRARDHLHLVVPQRFFVRQQRPDGDKHVYAQRSRFIDKAMLPLFDDIFWPPIQKLTPSAAPTPGAARLDLTATMRSMWAK